MIRTLFVFCLLLQSTSAFALFGSNAVVAKTQDRTDCIPAPVQEVLKNLAKNYGGVEVVSGYRSPKDNKRRGGADGSQHMQCKAADFLIPNRSSRAVQVSLQKFLLSQKATYKIRYNVYCTGRAHIDNNTQGLPDSYSSCVEKETWRSSSRPAKTYRRTHKRVRKRRRKRK